jgi:adenylate kinase
MPQTQRNERKPPPKEKSGNAKLIILTGTPGTGKSTVASHLKSEQGISIIEISMIIQEQELFLGYDHRRETLILDESAVNKYLKMQLDPLEEVWIVGHSVQFPVLQPAQWVVVLRCEPGVLRKRLERRGYSSEKINENVEAEIMQICLEEAQAFFTKATLIEVDTTTKSNEDVVKEIFAQIHLKSRSLE